MQRLKRVWGQIKDSWRKSITAVGIILLIAVLISVVGDYFHLGIFSGAGVRGKTLWDWLQLLIIPAVLASGAMWFSKAEREAERQIADDRLQESTLQAYLDRMTDLLLKEQLRTSKADDEVRSVARARTLTTLRQLDGIRKGTLLQFLYEADLINRDNAVIVLEAADLSYVYLDEANLSEANLSEANLIWAKLSGANLFRAFLNRVDLSGANLSGALLNRVELSGANLSGANLTEANVGAAKLRGAIMTGADLAGADLSGADLRRAKLNGANLREADLGEANLDGANLSWADLVMADLSGAKLSGADLSGITYNDHTIWPNNFTPPPGSIKKE